MYTLTAGLTSSEGGSDRERRLNAEKKSKIAITKPYKIAWVELVVEGEDVCGGPRV